MNNIDVVLDALKSGAESSYWEFDIDKNTCLAEMSKPMPVGDEHTISIAYSDDMSPDELAEFIEEALDAEIEQVNSPDFIDDLYYADSAFEEDESLLNEYTNTLLSHLNILYENVENEIYTALETVQEMEIEGTALDDVLEGAEAKQEEQSSRLSTNINREENTR